MSHTYLQAFGSEQSSAPLAVLAWSLLTWQRVHIVPFERTLTLHHEDAKYMYAFQLFFRQAGAGTD